MKYTRRTVTSRAGMSQEEALTSLQEHPEFARRGMKIAGIKRRGDAWVATLLEPKTAGDNPFGGDEGSDEPKDEAPKSEAPSSDDSDDDSSSDDSSSEPKSDGPPSPDGDDKKEKGGGDKEVLDLLHAIADALGVAVPGALPDMPGGGPDEMGGPDLPPGPDAGPDAGAGLAAMPPAHRPTKLKPGETLPHQTPVGSPAFASTNAGRVASMTVSSSAKFSSLKEAKDSLERVYGPHGYKVKQIRQDGDKIRALLSVR